ncbi:MAG TPA: VWA domain-containing protein [Thermoanaerobaculia bacterium]|nr:VWA domain-containing protein [Thermoanaerobaculia bacterium]
MTQQVWQRIALVTLALFATAVVALGAAPESGTQAKGETEGDSSSGFYDTVNVSVVNVDVYVTDRQGKPVTGLKKDDFELFEDGQPVKVTNFYAVAEGHPRHAPKPQLKSAQAPAPVPPNAQPQVPPEQQLSLIVYIDNTNIHPFSRNRVFSNLRRFLDNKVKRGDRVMLVSYDHSLHIRHPFTTDPGVIASALFKLETMTGGAVQADSDRRDIIKMIDQNKDVNSIEVRVRQYAESVQNDLSFTLDALNQLVNSLAGLPGRKAVLYVSDGLPMNPAQDLYYAIQSRYPNTSMFNESFTFDASQKFEELTAQANSNRVAFYTIDAGGLRVDAGVTAESRSIGLGIDVAQTHRSNLQSSLRLMAQNTGGLAILNTNDVTPGLDKVAQDFNTYYSLGYTPGHAGDGRYHRISVKIKGRRDLKVRSRKGYRDKTTESRMADGTMSTLIFGYENNPLKVSLRFGAATRREDGYYLVPVNIRLPIGQLVLVPRNKAYDARVEVFVSAMDTDGRTSPVQRSPVPITIPADKVEKAKKQFYTYEARLLMRSGEQRVAVGVRDDIGATESFVQGVVDVGEDQ